MGRRLKAGEVKSIKILSREIGFPPYSPILKATFEFTLADGRIIESTEDFGSNGIMDENLESLLNDLKKIAGLL